MYIYKYLLLFYSQTVQFSASLTSSSSELSVHPTTGLLPSIDERGTLFTITYTPKTFNKSCQGRLKIEVCIYLFTYYYCVYVHMMYNPCLVYIIIYCVTYIF